MLFNASVQSQPSSHDVVPLAHLLCCYAPQLSTIRDATAIVNSTNATLLAVYDSIARRNASSFYFDVYCIIAAFSIAIGCNV